MSSKNMMAMLGAMMLMRNVDQEDLLVIRYARFAFVIYVHIVVAIYFLMYWRISSRKDLTLITVPAQSQRASLGETFRKAQEEAERRYEEEAKKKDAEPNGETVPEEEEEEKEEEVPAKNADKKEDDKKPKEERITVMEYDLRQLASARRSWVMNCFILTAIHFKMESVSPLVMSSLSAIMKLVGDDPLFQIHIRGEPAVGKLQRPFKPSENPLAKMLSDMNPKPEAAASASATAQAPQEDLHDDGDSDVDDGPVRLEQLTDDNVASDFVDEAKKDK